MFLTFKLGEHAPNQTAIPLNSHYPSNSHFWFRFNHVTIHSTIALAHPKLSRRSLRNEPDFNYVELLINIKPPPLRSEPANS